jgi:hypothetical protein
MIDKKIGRETSSFSAEAHSAAWLFKGSAHAAVTHAAFKQQN